MELSRKLWRISKSWIILFWWLDRESLLCKLLLLCFPGWQQMTHMILCKMDVLFGCSYKNLLNWLFFFSAKSQQDLLRADPRQNVFGWSLAYEEYVQPVKGQKVNTMAKKWIPDFWINRNHGMEVVFQHWKVLMSSPFSQALFFGSQILLFLRILSCLHDQLSWEYIFNQDLQKLI